MNLYNISPQVHLVFLLVIQFGLHRIFYNPLFFYWNIPIFFLIISFYGTSHVLTITFTFIYSVIVF